MSYIVLYGVILCLDNDHVMITWSVIPFSLRMLAVCTVVHALMSMGS